MHPRSLRYFDQVARSTSIRDAAEKLFVTPTAVARQIELLEQHYGAPLVERSHRGISLTSAGTHVAQAVSSALKVLDQAEEHIASEQGVISGTVRILAAESLAPLFILPTMAAFHRQHPTVCFDINYANASQIAEGLLLNQADLAMTFYMPLNNDIDITHRCVLNQHAIMAAHHPLATLERVTLADLADWPLAVPKANFAIRQSLAIAARENHLSLDIHFLTSSFTTQKQLAAMGRCIALLPQSQSVSMVPEPELTSIELDEPRLERVEVNLCLPRQRATSLASRLFHQQLAEAMQQESSHAPMSIAGE